MTCRKASGVDSGVGCRIVVVGELALLGLALVAAVLCLGQCYLAGVKALCVCEYSVSGGQELAQGTACNCHRRVAGFCRKEVARK